ncbi:MAG: orotidine-5'-phosphate decarboxylase [Gammaproteobacteria bacterium]|nr:orotidine-5'-phosphate decarboxylase [Pseudomonadota bacterium]MCH9662712.1 orotidine-5'-phosphate decarboxylase [Gammaproteobacteria bacterium]
MATMHTDATHKIIVALDVNSAAEALKTVRILGAGISCYKVGYQLFFREGMAVVHALLDLDKRVFLDLKLGDIGNTMRAGLDAIPSEVSMLTIQGNRSVAEAAVSALRERQPRPEVLLLTALSTSVEDEPGARSRQIITQTQLALATGCDGVIASGDGVALARQCAGDKPLNIVAPGIRPRGSDSHDQRHVLSPALAIANGADRLVIGRALTQADDPAQMLARISDEINEGLSARTR